MQVTLSGGTKNTMGGTRHPLESDKRALAELMFAAYQGTIDYTGESVEDAEKEIVRTFAGAYGKFLPSCSYVVESGSQIVCASLITVLDQGPLLAFAMTSPPRKRQGLARAKISKSMQDLFDTGATNLHLVVNPRNSFAINLYESLGFRGKDSAA